MYREAQQHEQTRSVSGFTSASGNYHGNIKWDGWWGEAGGEAGEKGRAEVTKDAASHVGQGLQLCSNSDAETVKGQIYILKCISVGK